MGACTNSPISAQASESGIRSGSTYGDRSAASHLLLAEAVPIPDDLHPVDADGRLSEPADGGIEAGAAAGGEDADATLGGYARILRLRRDKKTGDGVCEPAGVGVDVPTGTGGRDEH